MIQRIQSVWLLLGMFCGVLLLYVLIWQANTHTAATGMDNVGAFTHLYLLPFPPLLFISHAVSIFTYKNRKRQLLWCNISIVLFILFLVAAFGVLEMEDHVFEHFNIMEFRAGILLPVIGIVCNIIAKRGIRKDESLVRSMDRLR